MFLILDLKFKVLFRWVWDFKGGDWKNFFMRDRFLNIIMLLFLPGSR